MGKKWVVLALVIFLILGYSFNSNAAANGQWKYSDGWWFEYADGSYAQNEYIDGYWINSSGYYDSAWNGDWKSDGNGWWFESGSWYPTNQWLKIDGNWYYFKSSGYMAANEWVGNYYMTDSGIMAVDTWIGDYYVGSDGSWIPGMTKSDPAPQTSDNSGNNFNHPSNRNIYVTSLQFDESNITIPKGDEKIINLTITPSNAYDKSITWYCYNTSVAVIEEQSDSSIKIKAKKRGDVTITATSSNGIVAYLHVNVVSLEMTVLTSYNVPYYYEDSDIKGVVESYSLSKSKYSVESQYTSSGQYLYKTTLSGRFFGAKRNQYRPERSQLYYKIENCGDNTVYTGPVSIQFDKKGDFIATIEVSLDPGVYILSFYALDLEQK